MTKNSYSPPGRQNRVDDPYAGACRASAERHERQLADGDLAGDAISEIIQDWDQIGANPPAAEFFAPRFVARSAGLSCILPTNYRCGHGIYIAWVASPAILIRRKPPGSQAAILQML